MGNLGLKSTHCSYAYPILPRKFKVVEEGARVLLVLREGKGKERGKREGQKLWGGRERELWCKV